MHSLALVPDTAAQLTNYTCTAQNSLGQGRATLQLSGGDTASTSSVIIVIILLTRAALAPGDLLGRAVGQPEQLRAGVEHRERPGHRPVHRPLQEAAGTDTVKIVGR